MTEQPFNLVLEQLKVIRAEIAKQGGRLDNLVAEVRITNGHIAALVQNEIHTANRIAEIDARLTRVENRLNLID